MSIVLLIFVIVYVVVTVASIAFVVKHFKRYRLVILSSVVLIFLLIPLMLSAWNYVLGKGLYEEYCSNAAGLQLYQEIERVDSLYIEDSKPFSYLEYGYKFVEAKEEGSYAMYFIDHDASENCLHSNQKFLDPGQCVASIAIEFPKSRYAVKKMETWETTTHLLNFRQSPILYDREIGEMVAALVDFKWKKGWIVSLIGASSQQCLKSRRGKLFEEMMSKTVYGEN